MAHPQLIEPVDDESLLAIVRRAFGPRTVLQESRLLKGGQFNTAYYLETEQPRRQAVLRIAPPGDRTLFRYERGMMPAEPWIYEQLAAAGIPVPRTVALDKSCAVIDRVYILQEYIDALPLNHADVPESVRPDLMRQAGRYAASIHAIGGDQFGWPVGDGTLRGGPMWSDVFGDLLAETLEQAEAHEVIGHCNASAVMARFEATRDVFDACGKPVLVHNDIWAPNILVATDGAKWSIRAIIDADRALFADREFEYILWDDEDLHDEFMEGYGSPLDPRPDAVWRRMYYRFYWFLFAAWAYRAQIWRPDAQAWCQGVAEVALQDILATAPAVARL